MDANVKMIDPPYQFHKLNSQGIAKAIEIASVFSSLTRFLNENCPAGWELSIVKTKLEEACFFAKKSIANVAENQAVE